MELSFAGPCTSVRHSAARASLCRPCTAPPLPRPPTRPQIFHFIDADHDGEISMHDLTVAMQHTGLDMEQQGVMRLLAGLDLARDGTVRAARGGALPLPPLLPACARRVGCVCAPCWLRATGARSLLWTD